MGHAPRRKFPPICLNVIKRHRKLTKFKTLFLDFDGVLHATLSAEDEYFNRASEVDAAIGSLDLDIVVSSSWRFHDSMLELIRPLPRRLRDRIVGATGPAVMGKHARWHEIRAYCERHRVIDWRALDDAWFGFPPDCPHLLLCDGATGVGPEQLDALKRWLRG